MFYKYQYGQKVYILSLAQSTSSLGRGSWSCGLGSGLDHVVEVFSFHFNFGLQKGCFSQWLWKSFGFFFGKILKYPIIDKTSCQSVRDVK